LKPEETKLTKHKLFWPSVGTIAIGVFYLLWLWWPGEAPESGAKRFASAWQASDYKAISASVHPDELKFMGATADQVSALLQDLKLTGSLTLSSIKDSRRAPTGKQVTLKGQDGKNYSLDLMPCGNKWCYSLGALLTSTCKNSLDPSGCTLAVADGMEKHKIKTLVLARQMTHAGPEQLRKYKANPAFGFRPLDKSLDLSEPAVPPGL
jgi:hypothetical protein